MPSINDGLFAARAGIQSHGTAIAVLGDNIANQNTVGFKAARADFVDLLAGSLGGGGATSTGSGSSAGKITRILTQGTFESTGRGLDLGIDGNGFFTLQNDSGNTYYTRAGNLQVDPSGNLLDQNGFYVMGYPTGGAGTLERLNVNERVSGDIGSEAVTISGNLNAAEDNPAGALAGGPSFEYAELNDGSNYQQQVTIYDSLGAQHTLNIYFNKAAAPTSNEWTAYAFIRNGDLAGNLNPADEASLAPNGTLTLNFNSNGQMTSVGTANLGPINWANGSSPTTIALDLSGFSQFASPNTTDSLSQDGTGSGSVTGFSVSTEGLLFAQLDNGQTSSIGTISLATFSNAEGLSRVGNSLFTSSTASGEPVYGTPNVGTFGALQSGALELSTSDLAADFIKLISLQRGFQGSSRVVSSINDLLNEIVNLAR